MDTLSIYESEIAKLDIPSSAANFGQCEHDTPYLTLVSKPIVPDNFQLGITEMNSFSKVPAV